MLRYQIDYIYIFQLKKKRKKNEEKRLQEKQSEIMFESKRFFSPLLAFNSEKAMAPHSSTLAWKIPWAEEPGRLQSMGSRRVGHD